MRRKTLGWNLIAFWFNRKILLSFFPFPELFVTRSAETMSIAGVRVQLKSCRIIRDCSRIIPLVALVYTASRNIGSSYFFGLTFYGTSEIKVPFNENGPIGDSFVISHLMCCTTFDAGNPPVRFGGRGKVNPLSLPLSILPPGSSCARTAARRIAGLAFLHCLLKDDGRSIHLSQFLCPHYAVNSVFEMLPDAGRLR
jgi:hypothetical protein